MHIARQELRIVRGFGLEHVAVGLPARDLEHRRRTLLDRPGRHLDPLPADLHIGPHRRRHDVDRLVALDVPQLHAELVAAIAERRDRLHVGAQRRKRECFERRQLLGALLNPQALVMADQGVGQQHQREGDGAAEQDPPCGRPEIGSKAAFLTRGHGLGNGNRPQPRRRRRKVGLGREIGRQQLPTRHLVGAASSAGDVEVVRHDQEAKALLTPQAIEQYDDFGFARLVEVAGRLVGEKQLRRIDQRTGDGDPPLLAARQHGREGVQAIGQADIGKKPAGASVGRFGIERLGKQRGQGDIVQGAEIGQEARELEDEADLACAESGKLVLARRPDVGTVQRHLALAGPRQRAQHGQQGRFART